MARDVSFPCHVYLRSALESSTEGAAAEKGLAGGGKKSAYMGSLKNALSFSLIQFEGVV